MSNGNAKKVIFNRDGSMYYRKGTDGSDLQQMVNFQWELVWYKSTRRSRMKLFTSNGFNFMNFFDLTAEELEKRTGNCINIYWNSVLVPRYHVNRSPTKNWGFLLESCWGLYANFDLPRRGSCPLLEDEMLNLTTESQISDITFYNRRITRL